MASPVVFLRNVALGGADTGGRTSTVGEPSLAVNGPNVFLTGNWYASRSDDDGASWVHVDPFTTLPPAAGGFCCDQTALFVPGANLTVWLLQYVVSGNANALRIAVNPRADLDETGWHFWDIRPADVDPAWAGQWFDYNHAAVSAQFLYVATNVFNIDPERFTRSVVFRIPLAQLSGTAPLTYDYLEATPPGNFSLRCAQGTAGTMYIACHNTLSQVSIYAWPESAATATRRDVNVSPWLAGAYQAMGPDGNNWVGRCDSRITGVWLAQGRIGIMWSANRRDPDRPLPYVRVIRLDENTLSVIDEPDIWSATTAYAYPDAYPNAAGDVGVTLFRGGGPNFPGHLVGFRDEAAGAWRLRVTRNGTDGPGDSKWGDYLACRRHFPSGDTWVAAGFTLQGGSTRADIEPRYVHFRR